MKHTTTILLLILTLIGCVPQSKLAVFNPQPQSGELRLFGYDFTKYADKDFLFTPYEYKEGYSFLATITLELIPEITNIGSNSESVSYNYMGKSVKIKKPIFKKDVDNYYVEEVNGVLWYIEIVDAKDAIEEMYNSALKFGANAIVSLDIRKEVRNNIQLSYSVPIISGYAIKRK